MKKIITIIIAVICFPVVLSARQLTEQEAMERALQYMNRGKSFAPSRDMAAPAKLEVAPVEAEKIYTFNMEGGGYVIASADSRALPVLGYSTTGRIDWSCMPDNMRSWLKHYDEAIATLGSRNDFLDGEQTSTSSFGQGVTTARQSRRAERTAVEPLIKTHWNQREPYWDQVPTYQGPDPNLRDKQCFTGCVATAVAQVMNYWQWPKEVPDGLPAYDYDIDYNGSNYTWHIGALPPTRFRWDLMLNDYYVRNEETQQDDPLGTDEQRKAVATLIRYCGQALKTTYNPNGSGAYSFEIPEVLIDYFDYNTPKFISHVNFPDIDKWEEIIYGELAAGRPMIYRGVSDQGGHSFVCDGYDGNGLFHINWGWGGSGDGYFALAVLNPHDNTSAGSGSSGIGFCIEEGAVIYTDPHMDLQPEPYYDYGSRFYQFDTIFLYNNNYAAFFYSFDEAYNEVADHALGTIDSVGNLHPLYMVDPNDSIVYSKKFDDNFFWVEIDSTVFATGQTVTLYPMLRFRHPGEEWQLIPPVKYNLTVGCDEDGYFFMRSNQKKYDLQLTDVAITKGTGLLDERSDITIRVRNNESLDYVSKLYLVPCYFGHITPEEFGIIPALAEGTKMTCGAYIPAKGEADVTFSFVPEYGGTIVFRAYTDDRYIGELPLEFNNDTLINYDPYLENKSYLSRDGDQWYWNVELADRIGTKMPHWIPSDSLYLRVRYYFNNEQVKCVKEETGLKEYLVALPDSIGTGNYTFTYQMPVEVGQPGYYFFDSYIAKLLNGETLNYSCMLKLRFTIDDYTGIDNKQADSPADQSVMPWFDLQGRPLNVKPTRRGLYIQGNRKLFIR